MQSMNTAPKSGRLPHSRTCGAFFVIWLAIGVTAAHAETPSVKMLLPGKWPVLSAGYANKLQVAGKYAYVAAGSGGLIIFDVNNPTNGFAVGGYDTYGVANG